MKQYDAGDLTREQVITRLESVQNTKSVDELYSFGSLLLNETRERVSRIESKANSVMVWSIALVAFIFSRVDSGKVIFHSAAMVPSILAVFSAGAAIACIFSAWMVMKAKYRPVIGDEEWLPSEDIDNPDELKLYHVRVMHLFKKQSNSVGNYKGVWLRRAQRCLATSGVLLALGVMLYCLVFSIHPPPHQ